METWKILIITIAAAIVAGAIAGICIGKYLVKRARSGRRRLLSTKERIVYSVCIVLGAACILFGVFFKFPSANETPPDGMITFGDRMIGGEDKVLDDGTVVDNGEVSDDGEEYDLPDGEVAEDGGVAVAVEKA